MRDVEILSVRRAEDDSGWHVRFCIDGIEPSAVWVESEGYLDRDELKDMLAQKMGFERPHILHRDLKITSVYLDDSVVSALEAEPSLPPRVAEFLFSLLAPKKSLGAQLGDLQEIFDSNVARFGKSRARMLYWTQVLRAIGPGLWHRVKRLGLIAFLIDYARSKLGF